jgi:hypothetical protein
MLSDCGAVWKFDCNFPFVENLERKWRLFKSKCDVILAHVAVSYISCYM